MSKIIIGQHPTTSYLQYDDVDNKLSLVKIDIETGGQIQSSDIVSGGGAKENITAFQVFPNSKAYAPGETIEGTGTYMDGKVVGYGNRVSGGITIEGIPAAICHRMRIRSYQAPEECDVVIDWGDGTIQELKNHVVCTTRPADVDEADMSAKVAGDGITAQLEYDYQVSHKYSIMDKIYTVKVYGKDYWSICYNELTGDTGLVSRVFEDDLPIASHLINFNQFCNGQFRLFNVCLPDQLVSRQLYSMNSMFGWCLNLRTAYGFNKIGLPYRISGIFGNCKELVSTDFRVPGYSYYLNSTTGLFANCLRLTSDVLSLLPECGFVDGVTVNVQQMFYNCGSLTCSDFGKLGKLLWNNEGVNFINTNLVFSECSSTIRSQVPTSWGGTNQNIDVDTDEMKSDYTAFEVMPNSKSIAVGTIDNLTGIAYGSKIFSSTTHKMHIVSDQSFENCDVVIDWGDGAIDSIKEGNYISYSNGKYEVHHDYSSVAEIDENGQWKRFIVKIYGKDYSTFRHDKFIDNNLISRIFTEDLPIASHITNFASMCYGAYRLLKITIPTFSNIFSNAYNLSSLFANCNNLTSVKGFVNNKLRDDCYVTGTFYYCTKLVETDFCLPAGQDYLHTTFTACNSLPMDISELFPDKGFTSKKIYIHGLFTKARILTGTVPAHLLWDDESIEWTLTTTLPFTDCPEEIRSQVPTSWGGTNEIIESKLQLRKLGVNFDDYTAFEVFAHDYDIPVGECEELNGEIYYAIPSDMCHKFQIRSEDLPETQDVVVDWGDGTLEDLSKYTIENISGSEGDWRYTLEHTYAANGKYIIKIFGKKYFALINGITSPDSNIICRVFDEDLPVASHISNFSSFARRSRHLLSVDVSKCNNFNKNFTNIANMFVSCPNLETAIGFRSINKINCNYSNLFNSCYSLKTCDLTISNCFDLSNIFKKCYYVELNLDSFFKYFNVTDKVSISITSLFTSCGSVYGTVPAHKLWNNKNITWTNTLEVFKGCSTDIKSQVPISWGGTASDDIIQKSVDQKLVLKADLVEGKVPAQQLPSYVDDVIEGTIDLTNNTMIDSEGNNVIPEKSKIYIDINTNASYRWTGTVFFEISSNIEIPDNIATTQYVQNYVDEKAEDFSKGNYVACICSVPPTSIVDGMIWIKGGTISPKYVSSITSPTVVMGQVDPSTCEDFTIIIK